MNAPAMMSDAPDMNLVSEWTTTSAPHFAGLMIMGLNVLSTTKVRPCTGAVARLKPPPKPAACMFTWAGLHEVCCTPARGLCRPVMGGLRRQAWG